MPSQYTGGGKNRIDVLRLENDSTPRIVLADGTTDATDVDDKVYSFTLNEEVKYGEDYSTVLTQYADDPEFEQFSRDYAPRVSAETAGLPEKTLQNGEKIGGTTANSAETISIEYGPTITHDTLGALLKVTVVPGKYSVKGFTHKSGDYTKPEVELKSTPLKGALTVAAAFLDAGVLPGTGSTIKDYASGAAVDLILPVGVTGRSFWVKKST